MDFTTATRTSRGTRPTLIRIMYAQDATDKPCLHCGPRMAKRPYDYCSICTDQAHEVFEQAALRNAATLPPIKVYRWNSDKRKWVPRSHDQFIH